MRAVEITKAGGPEVLQLCERPMPEAGTVKWSSRSPMRV